MKTTAMAGLLVALALGVSGADAEAAQRGGGAPSCTTLACDVRADWERTRVLVLALVNAMPDDKFGFKPTPAQGTFAERAMHVATTDMALFGTLGRHVPAATLANPKATTKADVVAALQTSFDYGTTALKELTDAQLAERVASMPFLGPTASRLKVIYFSMQHTQDIYGQLVVYLRLNGITPPASNRSV